jgi:hypothetical protein
MNPRIRKVGIILKKQDARVRSVVGEVIPWDETGPAFGKQFLYAVARKTALGLILILYSR